MGTTTVTQKASIGHIATDPLRNFKFIVRINHNSKLAVLGFMSVSGFNISTEVIPYRQGGYNTTTQKMPGQSDFAPITMANGLAVGNDAQFAWMKELFTVQQGSGAGAPGHDFRSTVDVFVLDHPVTTPVVPVKAAFRVYNAWPTSVAFSDLDAGANAIIVQQLTLAHEGFDFKVAAKVGTSGVTF
jgi:phage tail-like protein